MLQSYGTPSHRASFTQGSVDLSASGLDGDGDREYVQWTAAPGSKVRIEGPLDTQMTMERTDQWGRSSTKVVPADGFKICAWNPSTGTEREALLEGPGHLKIDDQGKVVVNA